MEGEDTQTETADETAAAETTQDATDGDQAQAGVDVASQGGAAAPASGGGTGGGQGAQSTRGGDSAPVDVDAELNAKDLLIDKFAAGLIGAEDYAKEVAKHDKAILKAQRELAKPAQQVQQQVRQQEAAQNYWRDWGKGQDVSQKMFGKTVKADRAAALFREAVAEVQANPRYQGRKELDADTIAYDKWMDKLEAEAKRKPATSSTPTPQTRVSGDVPVSQSGGGNGKRMTAREKLENGDYQLD